jgi:anti-sigma B factor antagonist
MRVEFRASRKSQGTQAGGQQRGVIVIIAVRLKEDAAILSLSGKFLAGSDGPDLRQKVKDLMDAGTQKLIISFADVPYIDSTGLGFLAGARVTVHNAGGRIVLEGLNLHVRKILDDVNLSQFFVIAANEDAAIALLNQAAPGTGAVPEPSKGEPKGEKRPGPTAEA